MALPLLPLVFGGGLALAIFAGGGEAPGPVTRAGVQVVPPVQREALLASLSPRGIAPAGAGAILATAVPAPSVEQSAGRWISGELARGRSVLLSSWVMGSDGPAELLSVDPSEVPEKAYPGSRWSVLVEPGGLPAPPPVPGIAPPDQPQPAAQAPAQAPALDQARQLPAAVRDTIRAALAQGASAPVLLALAREIEGQAPDLAEELRREAQNRAVSATPAPSGTHVVRLDGDTPFRLAQWYTGDGSRWRELLELNGLQAVKDPATGNTYASPWKLGQVIKLPASWPAKAPLPRGDVGGKAPAPAAPDIERIKRDVQQQIQAQQQSAAAQVSGDDEIGARPKPKKKKAAGFAGLAGQLRALSAARRDPEARKRILRKTTTIRRIKEQAESGDELAQVVQRALDQLAQQDAEQQAESAPPTPEAPPELPEGADTQSIEIVTETT